MGWRAQLGTVEGALDAQGFQIYSNNQLQAAEAEGGRPPLIFKHIGSSFFRSLFPSTHSLPISPNLALSDTRLSVNELRRLNPNPKSSLPKL